MSTFSIQGKTLIPVSQIVLPIPGSRGCKSVGTPTKMRWGLKGARSASGALIKLQIFKVGGRWYTDQASVDEFVRELSALPGDGPTVRTPAEARRASEKAEKELISKGC